MSAVQSAVDVVIEALDRAAEKLTPIQYEELLEELIADFEIRAEAAASDAAND